MPLPSDFVLTNGEEFGLVRPRTFCKKNGTVSIDDSHPHNKRFTYRRVPVYNLERFDPIDNRNMMAEVCLWKWAMSPEYCSPVNKDKLIMKLFPNVSDISTTRIGRILSAAIAKPINYQTIDQYGNNEQRWSFQAPGEVIYGMEYMIIQWLPWYRRKYDGPEAMRTINDFREEMKFFEEQSYDEIREYFMVGKS